MDNQKIDHLKDAIERLSEAECFVLAVVSPDGDVHIRAAGSHIEVLGLITKTQARLVYETNNNDIQASAETSNKASAKIKLDDCFFN